MSTCTQQRPTDPLALVSVPDDWRFLTAPKWLLSHIFVAGLLVAFAWAGFWQVGRLAETKDLNALIEARSALDPIQVADLGELAPDETDFQPVSDTGRYVDEELIRVANRSLDGVAGDWVVALFETDSGELVLVNRGFIRRDDVAAAPLSPASLTGWFRKTEEKDSAFGATDTGTGERVPRLDVQKLAERFDVELSPDWIQLAPGQDTGFVSGGQTVLPEALALPPLSNGSHLSYAVQWFTFTVLGAGAYLLVLRKLAHQRAEEIPSARVD